MKKNLFIITGAFLLIIVILTFILIAIKSRNMELSEVNAEYEFYLNKEIYGTELATLINKAIDNNKRREVEIDENGCYTDNGIDSILISISIIGSDEKFPMEKIFSLGTEQFVALFNSGVFVSDSVTYHKNTGRIATISFKQITE